MLFCKKCPHTALLTHRIATVVALTVFAALSIALVLLSGSAGAQTAPSVATTATQHTASSRQVVAPHRAANKRRVPRLNRHALAVARSKLGHPYVFGAEGPRKFDCSGLTHYSYARAGKHIPRTADAQFHAARRIPRRHLRPGDLVFYHRYGHHGTVFHVGMYVSHGMTVAAVDPAEGVTWQRIDSGDATYGSFTHR
jgi:cell wall-associated NlpC family hydrolase